jgi:hypothetical protein
MGHRGAPQVDRHRPAPQRHRDFCQPMSQASNLGVGRMLSAAAGENDVDALLSSMTSAITAEDAG